MLYHYECLPSRAAGSLGMVRGSRNVQEMFMSDQVQSPSRSGIYSAITNKIVAAIEAGAGTSKMPWHCPGRPIGIPLNATTYAKYRGINVLALWIAALEKNYATGEWASYR